MTLELANCARSAEVDTYCFEYDKMAADQRTRGDSRAGFTAHALDDVLESIATHSKAFLEIGRIPIECAICLKVGFRTRATAWLRERERATYARSRHASTCDCSGTHNHGHFQ